MIPFYNLRGDNWQKIELTSRKCDKVIIMSGKGAVIKKDEVWRCVYRVGWSVMTWRRDSVTYASCPRFTNPRSALRFLRHACKSIQTITHPAQRVSATRRCHDYCQRQGSPLPGRGRSPACIGPTGPVHSAVNGISASHLSNGRRRVLGRGGGKWLAYRYVTFEPSSLTDWQTHSTVYSSHNRAATFFLEKIVCYESLPVTPSHATSTRVDVCDARGRNSSFWNVIRYRRRHHTSTPTDVQTWLVSAERSDA